MVLSMVLERSTILYSVIAENAEYRDRIKGIIKRSHLFYCMYTVECITE
jgi:hypothetical protein